MSSNYIYIYIYSGCTEVPGEPHWMISSQFQLSSFGELILEEIRASSSIIEKK